MKVGVELRDARRRHQLLKLTAEEATFDDAFADEAQATSCAEAACS